MYLLREANEYGFYRWPFHLTVTKVAMATIAMHRNNHYTQNKS